MAIQTLKDPYSFDFLAMRDDYDEKELENALVNQITQFLLELGTGFSYVGRQVHLQVGEREFYIDSPCRTSRPSGSKMMAAFLNRV